MGAVKLTKHATERMQERSITTHDIIRVLAFGEQTPTRRPLIYQSRIPRGDRASEAHKADRVSNVVVVFQHGDHSDEITVVTTYRQ